MAVPAVRSGAERIKASSLVESLSRIRFANCGAWPQIDFVV
jgi:hypothetical protein